MLTSFPLLHLIRSNLYSSRSGSIPSTHFFNLDFDDDINILGSHTDIENMDGFRAGMRWNVRKIRNFSKLLFYILCPSSLCFTHIAYVIPELIQRPLDLSIWVQLFNLINFTIIVVFKHDRVLSPIKHETNYK